MRKLVVAIAAVSIALVVAAAAVLLQPRERPLAYPCVSSSKDGWLTAVSGRALVRIEWSEGAGRLGVGPPRGPLLQWFPLSEREARAQVLEVLAPLSRRVHSASVDAVSFFVGCDGHGEFWAGLSPSTPSSYRDCLHPGAETRLACVKRVFDEGSLASADELPGAISDRLDAIAIRAGMTLPPPSTRLPPRPPPRRSLSPPPPPPPSGTDIGIDVE